MKNKKYLEIYGKNKNIYKIYNKNFVFKDKILLQKTKY